MLQYEVSRHLAVLRRAGLVTSRKQGKWVYYSLVDEPAGLGNLWQPLGSSFDADREMARDVTRMRARLNLRKGGVCVVGIGGRGCRGGPRAGAASRTSRQ